MLNEAVPLGKNFYGLAYRVRMPLPVDVYHVTHGGDPNLKRGGIQIYNRNLPHDEQVNDPASTAPTVPTVPNVPIVLDKSHFALPPSIPGRATNPRVMRGLPSRGRNPPPSRKRPNISRDPDIIQTADLVYQEEPLRSASPGRPWFNSEPTPTSSPQMFPPPSPVFTGVQSITPLSTSLPGTGVSNFPLPTRPSSPVSQESALSQFSQPRPPTPRISIPDSIPTRPTIIPVRPPSASAPGPPTRSASQGPPDSRRPISPGARQRSVSSTSRRSRGSAPLNI